MRLKTLGARHLWPTGTFGQHTRAATLAKRKSELVEKLERLLNAYLAGTVDDDAFKAKTAQLKADTARVTEEEIDAESDMAPSWEKTMLAVFAWSQKAAKI